MDTKKAAASLGRVLADSYVLMLKTQSVHWHVVGGAFVGIHNLTEEQYSELFLAVDEIAERIRAIGETAPGTMAEYLKLARLQEGSGGGDDVSMVSGLVAAHSQISDLLRAEIDIMDDLDDYGSEDLLVGRLRVHEKSAWMLKSILTQLGGAAPVTAPVKLIPEKAVSKHEDKPAKKEKKKKSKTSAEKPKKAAAAPVKKAVVARKPAKEVPLPFKKPAAAKPEVKKEEPVVASNNGGRRRLFGVKADG